MKWPCCKWDAWQELQLVFPTTWGFSTLTNSFFISIAVKELSYGEAAEGCGLLLLPLSRLQKSHAKPSLSLSRVARPTAALLPGCMGGCLHGCMTACMPPFTCCPAFRGRAGASKLWLPFLLLGVREGGNSRGGGKGKIHLGPILQSLGWGSSGTRRTHPVSPEHWQKTKLRMVVTFFSLNFFLLFPRPCPMVLRVSER